MYCSISLPTMDWPIQDWIHCLWCWSSVCEWSLVPSKTVCFMQGPSCLDTINQISFDNAPKKSFLNIKGGLFRNTIHLISYRTEMQTVFLAQRQFKLTMQLVCLNWRGLCRGKSLKLALWVKVCLKFHFGNWHYHPYWC